MRENRRWQWSWMPTAVFLIGMFSITLLVWVRQISERQLMHSHIIEAIMDIQIDTATGHLWLEEAIDGDPTADEALKEMNHAIDLANTVLNGGGSDHGLIQKPLTDPQLRVRAEAIRAELLEFKAFALERLRKVEQAGVGSEHDQRFDEMFKQILGKASDLEDSIQRNRDSDQTKSTHIFLSILFAWAVIITAATVGLWNRENRRKIAEEALLQANEQLRSQAEELTEHREHLTELVEKRTGELTTANELLQVENTRRRRMEDEVRKLNEELEAKIAKRTQQLLETQDNLVRSEKLALLGQIAGNMGNELRNPLGVMNNAVFFLENVLPDADATVREYLEIIRSEIDNSQRIISDLLDFCQNKPGKADLCAIQELISGGFEGCTIPENIRSFTDLPESLPPVEVDPLQIKQAVRHLIVNAVQAMPHGGSLRVAARRTTNGGSSGFIEISVTDTGTGILPENLPKLFQPLFTTKSRGIGLGLAISKKLIEANGGRIEVDSGLREGASFIVFLPLRRSSDGNESLSPWSNFHQTSS